MTPYSDFLYFGILLYVLALSLIFGLVCRRALTRVWIVLGTACMLMLQYGTAPGGEGKSTLHTVELVAGYALLQWIVARGFLAVRQRGKRRAAYYAALILALAPLAFVKFAPLFGPGLVIGFLGVSYLTFRCVDVIMNMQDGTIMELPVVQYLAYLLFFPTISSGPIDRYRRFAADWNRHRSRAEFLEDLNGAVQRVARGFLYKFILAALIKQHWMGPVDHGAAWFDILSYMYAYSLYLFFDFAGYSAFAVGLSYLLGIHTPENFKRPFLARSIREFWDRWHISLSWWFRDHVYTRFVFAATKGRWFKRKEVTSYLGFFLSMGLMGLWHGTAWFYLVYGLYHGALLSLHDGLSRWNKHRRWWGSGRVANALAVLLTFNVVCFGLLIFSGRLSAQALGPGAPKSSGLTGPAGTPVALGAPAANEVAIRPGKGG